MNKLENARYIFNALTMRGITAEAACGMLGNLEAESGIEPTNLENTGNAALNMSDLEYTRYVDDGTYVRFITDGRGYGLAQWTYWSRKEQLQKFITSRGYPSIGSLEGQTDFLIHELQSSFATVWDFLKETHSIRGASNIILLRFENPKDQGPSVQEYRVRLSEEWYEKLVAGTIPVEEPEKPKNEYWPPRMIDKNMKGADVSLLQAVLNCRGYGTRIDGIFGDDLDKKVRQFQADNDLAVDGIVGPKTWRALAW